MKKYDIVRTPKGTLAIVLEIQECDYEAIHTKNINISKAEVSIDFINGNPFREKSAWWEKRELKVVSKVERFLKGIYGRN